MQSSNMRADDLFGQIEGLVADLEAEREARLAAEAASADTFGLIDVVSKKLKPPMESVTELTDRILSGPLNVAQRRDAESLSLSMHRILNALTEVLDFNTLETGEAEFSVEAFDFHAVVREAASGLQACARAKGLASSVDMAPNCPRFIVGDVMRVRQVIMTLLEASIRNTEQGTIRLYVSVNDAVDPVTIRFDITDTSAGFTVEQQEALFQPSADAARTDGGLGLPIAQRLAEAMGGGVSCDSALGQGALYWFTFKALVEDERAKALVPGEANEAGSSDAPHTPVAAAPDLGIPPTTESPTTEPPLLELDLLELELPELDLSDAEPATPDLFSHADDKSSDGAASASDGGVHDAPQADEAPAASAQSAKHDEPGPASDHALESAPVEPTKEGHAGTLCGHVLLIEDNSVNRLLIGAYLDEFGMTFDVAETGAAALMCLDRRPYDLVLMDTHLPDYRGAQLATRIRSLETPMEQVPIVALAALSGSDDEDALVETGVNASVDKPIQGRELYAALAPLVAAKDEAEANHAAEDEAAVDKKVKDDIVKDDIAQTIAGPDEDWVPVT
ncbi:MAG: response regulator [Pseudomonadota bacterium]